MIMPLGRVMYENVFSKDDFGDDPSKYKYNVTMLYDKDEADMGPVRKALQAKYKEKWGSKKFPSLWNPIRDGDAEHPDSEIFANKWFVKHTTSRAPRVVDRDRGTITEASGDFYSGCYAYVSCTPDVYDAGGSKGMALYLSWVQKAKDGEYIVASGDKDDFVDMSDEDDETPFDEAEATAEDADLFG